MRSIPINTEESGAFHCPLTKHPQASSDILPGFKRRCNRIPGVLMIFEVGEETVAQPRHKQIPIFASEDGCSRSLRSSCLQPTMKGTKITLNKSTSIYTAVMEVYEI